jgi:hypothetical protein
MVFQEKKERMAAMDLLALPATTAALVKTGYLALLVTQAKMEGWTFRIHG